MIQNLSVSELNAMLNQQADQLGDWQMIDVREPWELERASIRHPQFRCTALPMATVPLRLNDVDRAKNLLVICRSGGRSMQVANFLAQQGFERIHNLQGGMTAWSREIDPSVPTY